MKTLPSFLGMATVCVASLTAQRMAVGSQQWLKDPDVFSDPRKRNRLWATSSYDRNDFFEIGDYVKIPLHHLRICFFGLLSFKMLGGRFWAIAPSSYTHLGSFSRWSIPCTEKYATAQQRTLIHKMGRRWGCHTCGSRMLGPTTKSFKFVGDHMPPKSVAERMNQMWIRRWGLWRKVQFRFFPQCSNCSNVQGSILGKATSQINAKGLIMTPVQQAITLKNSGGGKLAHFHGLRFRLNHLAGGVLAGATVVGATDREIANGNPKRFQKMQQRIVEAVKRVPGFS